MILTIAIFSVFLCSVQGNEVNPENSLEGQMYMKEHKKFLGHTTGWLSDMMKNLKAHVEETTLNFQQLSNTLVEDGKAELELHYTQTMLEVMGSSAPQQCITAAQEELKQLKANNLNSFFSCKNLTQGVKDIIGMGLEISKLTVQVLLTADEVINGVGSCKTWNIFKFFYCTFNWVKDSLTDIVKCVEAVTDFTKHMSVLISDLKSQIDYCLHGSKATALMHHVQVLTNIQQCAAKSK